mmetsp:Transcript_62481/g.176638  ORF Transcript_62481/g.176638 Transcript_62481/m.176638 type:complete len:239 (-) Transcript_62481:332-1048(-)
MPLSSLLACYSSSCRGRGRQQHSRRRRCTRICRSSRCRGSRCSSHSRLGSSTRRSGSGRSSGLGRRRPCSSCSISSRCGRHSRSHSRSCSRSCSRSGSSHAGSGGRPRSRGSSRSPDRARKRGAPMQLLLAQPAASERGERLALRGRVGRMPAGVPRVVRPLPPPATQRRGVPAAPWPVLAQRWGAAAGRPWHRLRYRCSPQRTARPPPPAPKSAARRLRQQCRKIRRWTKSGSDGRS